MNQPTTQETLARLFHDTYERLAPQFGYETRPDTKAFDPTSANGRLMMAVCEEIRQHLTAHTPPGEVVDSFDYYDALQTLRYLRSFPTAIAAQEKATTIVSRAKAKYGDDLEALRSPDKQQSPLSNLFNSSPEERERIGEKVVEGAIARQNAAVDGETPETDAKEKETIRGITESDEALMRHAHYGWKHARTLERQRNEAMRENARLKLEIDHLDEIFVAQEKS